MPRAAKSAAAVSAAKARAAASGKTGEQVVAELHAAASSSHVVRLYKVPTPTAGFPPRLRYRRHQPTDCSIDFVGHALVGHGLAVFEEVKTCSSKARFALSEVEPHQREQLDACWRAGGIALLVVVYGAARTPCLFQWPSVRERVSLGPDELLGAAVTPAGYTTRLRSLAEALSS